MLTQNQLRIYRALRKNGAMIRKDIVILLNIPRTTVIDALHVLEGKGFIEKFPIHEGCVGRPFVGWEVIKA